MKKYLLLVLFLLPLACMSQIVGVAGQLTKYNGDHKFQFNASASFPYVTHLGDNVSWMLSGGGDYLSGSSPMSGLNLKPVSFAMTTTEIFGTKPYTVMIGVESGYNFNFNHGYDGVVLTPYVYADYRILYVKAGYDYNTFENKGQFYVRMGVGLGVGFFKMFKRK